MLLTAYGAAAALVLAAQTAKNTDCYTTVYAKVYNRVYLMSTYDCTPYDVTEEAEEYMHKTLKVLGSVNLVYDFESHSIYGERLSFPSGTIERDYGEEVETLHVETLTYTIE